MRINIVMGFFLPIPPAAGGAVEKSWHELALEFARRGHEVTVVSRTWPGWPDSETSDGVRHLRLRGHDHTRSLPLNLWHDLAWSLRVGRALPPADITVANCIALPALPSLNRALSGKLAVMTGRVPKGQYRAYRRVDWVIAVSSPVRDAILAENPRLAPVTRIYGYPIHWDQLAAPRERSGSGPVTIGFIGRIHPEKGLGLLVSSLARLGSNAALPPWRMLFCGPQAVEQGGAGSGYARSLRTDLESSLRPGQFEFLPPEFNGARLAALYRQLDIFCYPSVAERGETFGVAVAEGMAARAVPVVSALRCFADFVKPGVNGCTFDHRAPDAAAKLATILAQLVSSANERERLAAAAQAAVRIYDYPIYADRLLADFSTLCEPTN